jgi:hypothetical protein
MNVYQTTEVALRVPVFCVIGAWLAGPRAVLYPTTLEVQRSTVQANGSVMAGTTPALATPVARCVRSWSSARKRCEMVFFVDFSISAYVCAKPSGWKQGSHPKESGPRARTICPCVRPTKQCTSCSGPSHRAKMHCAYALLSGHASMSFGRPSVPSFSRKYFMYTLQVVTGVKIHIHCEGGCDHSRHQSMPQTHPH